MPSIPVQMSVSGGFYLLRKAMAMRKVRGVRTSSIAESAWMSSSRPRVGGSVQLLGRPAVDGSCARRNQRAKKLETEATALVVGISRI